MIVYKILNDKIIGISRQADNYSLLTDERGSNTWYLKPHYNGTEVEESITQQEIDDAAEAEAEQSVSNDLQTELNDGIEAAHKLKIYLKRNLSAANYKASRVLLRPVWESLRMGDWDIALDEITVIDDANSNAHTQKIKTRIENYLIGDTNYG